MVGGGAVSGWAAARTRARAGLTAAHGVLGSLVMVSQSGCSSRPWTPGMAMIAAASGCSASSGVPGAGRDRTLSGAVTTGASSTQRRALGLGVV